MRMKMMKERASFYERDICIEPSRIDNILYLLKHLSLDP